MYSMPKQGFADATSPPRPRQEGKYAKHLSQREQLHMLHKERSEGEIDTGVGQQVSKGAYLQHSRYSAPPKHPLHPPGARVMVNQSSVKLPGQTFG